MLRSSYMELYQVAWKQNCNNQTSLYFIILDTVFCVLSCDASPHNNSCLQSTNMIMSNNLMKKALSTKRRAHGRRTWRTSAAWPVPVQQTPQPVPPHRAEPGSSRPIEPSPEPEAPAAHRIRNHCPSAPMVPTGTNDSSGRLGKKHSFCKGISTLTKTYKL